MEEVFRGLEGAPEPVKSHGVGSHLPYLNIKLVSTASSWSRLPADTAPSQRSSRRGARAPRSAPASRATLLPKATPCCPVPISDYFQGWILAGDLGYLEK